MYMHMCTRVLCVHTWPAMGSFISEYVGLANYFHKVWCSNTQAFLFP